MNTFDFKGTPVTVYNEATPKAVDFIHNDTPDPIRAVSGRRIEFPYGGGQFIFHIPGMQYDEVTAQNRIQAQAIFLVTLADGKQQVMNVKDVGYSVHADHFRALATLASIAGSSMLDTQGIHKLNGLMARIAELGGDLHGRGIELFNNDGTVDTPLFTYKRENPNSSTLEIVPIKAAPIDWKLLLTNPATGVKEEVVKTTETMNADGTTTTTTEQTLIATDLASGFHQFTYQELDAAGAVTAEQARNILV